MKRGAVTKSECGTKLVLERKMLGTLDVLALDMNSCIGCDICVRICPQEAVKLSKAMIQNGKFLKKGLIDIDAGRCTLCGMCVVLCPTNAIEMLRNGKQMVPVIEAEAFPNLLKEIMVDVGKCDPSCGLVCQESCPIEAINITAEKAESGKIAKILEVHVDRRKCIFCGKCELACPQTAIHVVKPLQGFVHLNTDLCPENCQACVEVCPSKILSLGEDEKLRIEERFCIYCGSCQETCPQKAIEVERTRVLSTSVNSGAWIKTRERLISYPYLVKESNAKSMKKLRNVVKNIDRF
jgi:4Fe-4S ferredoxin